MTLPHGTPTPTQHPLVHFRLCPALIKPDAVQCSHQFGLKGDVNPAHSR